MIQICKSSLFKTQKSLKMFKQTKTTNCKACISLPLVTQVIHQRYKFEYVSQKYKFSTLLPMVLFRALFWEMEI